MNKNHRRIAVYTLTGGACTYLGLLSLGGMYALYPYISIALLSFTLSVAYEGEIYKQNLTHALKKLIQPNNLQKSIAKLYLKNLFDARSDIYTTKAGLQSSPKFFSDYLFLLLKSHHDTRAAKKLKDLENWFCEVVIEKTSRAPRSPYEQELLDWLAKQKPSLQPAHWQKNYQAQSRLKRFVAIPLSVLASIFTTIGTTYLLFETITIVPALLTIPLAIWSALIVPLALSAGLAYGLLTYNCTSDFLRDNPFSKWFHKINAMRLEGQFLKAGFLGASFSFLCLLAIGLTICTAGTWCTIVSQGQSFYARINQFPKWIMGVINPIVITLSSTAFNLQNTSDTFGLLSKAATTPFHWIKTTITDFKKTLSNTWRDESWLQFINPFRALNTLLFSPSRILLFFGHLISIGVTSDRVPKVSEELSALLGIVCEFGEDWHYFFDVCHGGNGAHGIKEMLEERLEGEGHNHALDLPTQALKLALAPIRLLSHYWEKAAIKIAPPPVAVHQAANNAHDHHDCCQHHAQPRKFNNKVSTWESKNPVWFVDYYQQKNSGTLSRATTENLRQFAQAIEREPRKKSQKMDAWTGFLKTTLEKHQSTLPAHFSEKFRARFGC